MPFWGVRRDWKEGHFCSLSGNKERNKGQSMIYKSPRDQPRDLAGKRTVNIRKQQMPPVLYWWMMWPSGLSVVSPAYSLKQCQQCHRVLQHHCGGDEQDEGPDGLRDLATRSSEQHSGTVSNCDCGFSCRCQIPVSFRCSPADPREGDAPFPGIQASEWSRKTSRNALQEMQPFKTRLFRHQLCIAWINIWRFLNKGDPIRERLC